MKKMSIILLGFLLGAQGAFSGEHSLVIGKRKIVKNVRSLLKSGELDSSRTCLDEFIERDRKLKRVMGLGIPGVGGGLPIVGGAVGAAIGSSASGGAAFLGLWAGAFVGGVAAPVGLLAYEAVALSIFVKNRFLIKVISNARDGGGKSLKRFRKSFYRNYGDVHEAVEGDFARFILEADEAGILCDGSLNKVLKGKKRPAWNREIYKYLSQSL